eukprot:Nitzschia sp. Nitz4//scaffold276_size25055//17209//22686//NITZ4_008343-RA/size25055-processed-gene-0.13-mRNA-1//-1//CDS//3329545331//3419//frame0
MDLQAILDSTDDSSEDDGLGLNYNTPSFPARTGSDGTDGSLTASSIGASQRLAATQAKLRTPTAGPDVSRLTLSPTSPAMGIPAGSVDLEQILREDDDDDDDDEGDVLLNGPSSSSYPPWQQSFPTEPASGASTSLVPYTSATGEDWDVLQAILGEDDEDAVDVTANMSFLSLANNNISTHKSVVPNDANDDIMGDWNKLNFSSASLGARVHVDAILQQSDDDDVNVSDEVVGSSSQWTPIGSPSPHRLATSNDRLVDTDVLPVPTDSFATAAQSDQSIKSTDQPLVRSSSNDENPPKKIHSSASTDWDMEKASTNALQLARNYERKLLRSGHRDIVSPLMVKRRLKPRIELDSKQQIKQRERKDEPSSDMLPAPKKDKRLVSSVHTVPVRFGFSGIVETKRLRQVSGSMKDVSPDLPTALCINSRFIAVGTQRGVILVFDLFETLRQKLVNGGDTPFNIRTAGSVTTVDLSLVQGEILAAGYTSGFIVLWDTIKGVALRTVVEHQNPSPITSVRFLNDLKLVTVDAGGLVNKLNFSRNILWNSYSVDSECLLDGTAGQILAMNVLAPYAAVHQKLPLATQTMKKIVLIALSSERSSFAVAVEPTVHVLHRWARPAPEQLAPPTAESPDVPADGKQVYLPCLSWGWALLSGGGNAITPILARAWGCSVQLLQASFQEESPSSAQDVFLWPAFGVHDEFQASAPVVALEWLNDRSLVYLTVNNHFTVVDTVMMTLIERLDFSGLRLVYAEFSLSRTAEENLHSYCTTFQNSVRCSDNRLLLLCREELKTISLIGAKRRISGLEQDGEWLEALALALDHYENSISSQQDKRRDQQSLDDIRRRHQLKSEARVGDEEWIAKLLIRYMNTAVDNAPELNESLPHELLSSQLELAQSHFQMLAGVCVDFCVVTKRLDLLFGAIFRRFQSVGFVSVFLDVLEPYILNDKLNYIAPEAMAHFVEHCRAANGIATVERCLLHMDVTFMDFDTILNLLKANEMYSALFYVYNQGLNDYTSPLEVLLERIFDCADTTGRPVSTERRIDGVPQNDFERFGYKAILYMQYCFQGRTFPQDLPIDEARRKGVIRAQLLQFLLQESFAPTAVRRPQELFGARTMSYPYTHILLMVDPKAMLDTLAIALNAPDADFGGDSNFESIQGWEVEVGRERTTGREGNVKRKPERQDVIGMLEHIIMPKIFDPSEDDVGVLPQSKVVVNAFLDFLAEYLMKGVVKANKDITQMILSRMAKRFESASSNIDRHHAQKELLQLLSALPRSSYDSAEVLSMVQKAGAHRVALLLHQDEASMWSHSENPADTETRALHFRAAIDCYLADDDMEFRKEVFAYAKKECSGASEGSTESNKRHKIVRDALVSKLAEMVQLDSLLAAELVAELFAEELDDVVEHLDDENAQFLFFKAIISGDLEGRDQVAGAVLNANLTTEHHHKYLALMCKLHPDEVYQYLQAHDNYRPEVCLPLCQQYEIADASTYLLERMGNVASALQLILQTLESSMMNLKRTIRGMGTEFFSKYITPRHPSQAGRKRETRHPEVLDLTEREIEKVKHTLIVALDLCERNSGTVTTRTEQGSQLWFNVLDRLINAKGFLRLSKEQPGHAKAMAGVLGELLRLTMHRMVSSVPLPDLVRKVTSDHSGSRLGELREMVESLLSTYGFDVNVFSGAVNIFHDDTRALQHQHWSLRVQGSGVTTVMNVPLVGASGTVNEVSLAEAVRDATFLQVGDMGSASVIQTNDKPSSNAYRGDEGLSHSLKKLRSRRRQTGNGSGVGRRSRPIGVSMMTVQEKTFNDGDELLDESCFEDRIAGVLGDAEHRGRLMSFMY